jgi:hypothetical protein
VAGSGKEAALPRGLLTVTVGFLRATEPGRSRRVEVMGRGDLHVASPASVEFPLHSLRYRRSGVNGSLAEEFYIFS